MTILDMRVTIIKINVLDSVYTCRPSLSLWRVGLNKP